LFEIGLQAAPENALKRCIFRLASAHFKSKRLYYCKMGESWMLLLCGGDKSNQQTDTDQAKEMKKGLK